MLLGNVGITGDPLAPTYSSNITDGVVGGGTPALAGMGPTLIPK